MAPWRFDLIWNPTHLKKQRPRHNTRDLLGRSLASSRTFSSFTNRGRVVLLARASLAPPRVVAARPLTVSGRLGSQELTIDSQGKRPAKKKKGTRWGGLISLGHRGIFFSGRLVARARHLLRDLEPRLELLNVRDVV